MWLFALFPVFSTLFVWFFLPVGLFTSVAWMLLSSLDVSQFPAMLVVAAVVLAATAILGPITARTMLSFFSDYYGVVALTFGNKEPLELKLHKAEVELEQWKTND
jgi:predicted permease